MDGRNGWKELKKHIFLIFNFVGKRLRGAKVPVVFFLFFFGFLKTAGKERCRSHAGPRVSASYLRFTSSRHHPRASSGNDATRPHLDVRQEDDDVEEQDDDDGCDEELPGDLSGNLLHVGGQLVVELLDELQPLGDASLEPGPHVGHGGGLGRIGVRGGAR